MQVMLSNGEYADVKIYLTNDPDDPNLITHLGISYGGEDIVLHYMPGGNAVTEHGNFNARNYAMMLWNGYRAVVATTPIGRAFSILMGMFNLDAFIRKFQDKVKYVAQGYYKTDDVEYETIYIRGKVTKS